MSHTILIADDDLLMLKLLRTQLEAEGMSVITSQDAYQALELALRHDPDLLVLDVDMPAGNGFSVQQRLARRETVAQTPVIYITAHSAEEVDRHAQMLGAFAVLHKPFAPVDLLEAIRAALGDWESPNADRSAA